MFGKRESDERNRQQNAKDWARQGDPNAAHYESDDVENRREATGIAGHVAAKGNQVDKASFEVLHAKRDSPVA